MGLNYGRLSGSNQKILKSSSKLLKALLMGLAHSEIDGSGLSWMVRLPTGLPYCSNYRHFSPPHAAQTSSPPSCPQVSASKPLP